MGSENEDQIIIRKINEIIDHSAIPKAMTDIIMTLLERPDSTQYICDLVKKLSDDDANLIRFALELTKYIVHRSYDFYERRRKDYEDILRWKRILSFDSPIDLNTQASDLAFNEMKRVTDYLYGIQQKMVVTMMETRKQLARAYEENVSQLIGRSSRNTPLLQDINLAGLESKFESLLERIEDME